MLTFWKKTVVALFASCGALGLPALLFALALMVPPQPVAAATIQISGTITSDTTWTADNVYVLNGDVTVAEGFKLTLQPGVVVKLEPRGSLFVRGALDARGTAAMPIVFTSFQDDAYGGDTDGDGAATPPAPGDWGSVQFEDTSDDAASVMQHVIVRYGGLERFGCCDDTLRGGITLVGAEPILSSITFQNNRINGVGIPGGSRAPSVTVSGERWANTGMVYVVLGDLTIEQNFTLTIAPGMIVKFAPGRVSLFVRGALDAQGSAEAPIIFTSLNDDAAGGDTDNDGALSPPAKDDWGFVQFEDTSDDATSVVRHAVFRYSGLERFGCCDDTRRGAITLVNAQPTLSNISFSGNSFNGVGILGGVKAPSATVSEERWANTGMVYILLGDVTIAQGFKLTIAPGMIIKAGGRTSLFVDGALDARGIAEAPIIFTSLNDDAAGGDSDGDGTATPPQKDDWGWVQFGDTSDDNASFVEHAVFRYSGLERFGCCDDTRSAALTLVNAQPTLSNLSFTNNHIGAVGVAASTKTSDERWSNVGVTYVVLGDVVVAQGAKLTIDAGQVVKFTGRTSLFVRGALDARGRPDAPIVFSSLQDDQFGGDSDNDGALTPPKKDDWGWVQFEDTSDNNASFVEYAIFRYSGLERFGCCDDTRSAALTLINAQPTVAHLSFEVNHISAVGIAGSIKTANETWASTTVTYAVLGDITVNQGAKLTITPGVLVKFVGRASIFVNGALEARGLPDAPIIFTSLQDDSVGGDSDADGDATPPAPGDWGWIQFNATSDSASVIEHAVVRYGGLERLGCCDDTWGATIRLTNATPRLARITFEQNYLNGAQIPGTNLAPTASRSGENWNNQDVVYIITGDVVVAQGYQLTIQRGMVVKFARNARITVQGAMDVRGVTNDPVYFTSLNDDELGGDTDNDGAATPPAPRDWGYIAIRPSVNSERTLIDHAVIRYGTSLYIEGSSPQLANSRLTLNQRGVEVIGGAQPLIDGNSIHNNQEYGVLVNASRPIIRQNNIYDNGVSGVLNQTGTICVNAQNNWWGNASGPSDDSARADSCELEANAGTGDKVSDHVDYDPWLATPPQVVGDLTVGALDVWTDPARITAGNLVGVGVNVRNRSTSIVTDIEVGIYDGNPARGGKPIGQGIYRIPFIGPWGVATQFTTRVWDTTGLTGVREIYIVVDPNNRVSEADEGNNVVVRRVQIAATAPPGGDTEPPTGSLRVNGGAAVTAERRVTLALDAADNPGGTGLARMYVVEFAFNSAGRQWVPAQESGWIPFAATQSWNLSEGGGIRALQVWLSDRAGNISAAPAAATINLASPNDALAAGDVRLFRLSLVEGQRVSLTATPASGDADLYVWVPGNTRRPDYFSNQSGAGVEQLTFVAPRTGVYQVQVHGYTSTNYTLQIGIGSLADTPLAAVDLTQAKTLPAAPLSLQEPPAQSGVPPLEAPPISGGQTSVYLPLIRR